MRNYLIGKTSQEIIGKIGFSDPIEIDLSIKRKVLITGAGSYIGQSFIKYANEHYCQNIEIEELDVKNDDWKTKKFSEYDIIYHVAGIAHADVGKVSDEIKEKYYKINTDLAISVAKKAKEDGVNEFIYMSSMIVYGNSVPYGKEKIVTSSTYPQPANYYGDSKLQADVAIRDLAENDFKVIILRPPMVYGRGSKGNYPLLAKLAKKTIIFPCVNNYRSMLYIENLCELLCKLILIKCINQRETVLLPQNAEWTNTAEMVKVIADVSKRKIFFLKGLKLAVIIGSKIPGRIGNIVNKAFGNSCYDKQLSIYEGIDYQIVNLNESVYRTEHD